MSTATSTPIIVNKNYTIRRQQCSTVGCKIIKLDEISEERKKERKLPLNPILQHKYQVKTLRWEVVASICKRQVSANQSLVMDYDSDY